MEISPAAFVPINFAAEVRVAKKFKTHSREAPAKVYGHDPATAELHERVFKLRKMQNYIRPCYSLISTSIPLCIISLFTENYDNRVERRARRFVEAAAPCGAFGF